MKMAVQSIDPMPEICQNFVLLLFGKYLKCREFLIKIVPIQYYNVLPTFKFFCLNVTFMHHLGDYNIEMT